MLSFIALPTHRPRPPCLYISPKFASLAESLKNHAGLCLIKPFATWLPPMSQWHGARYFETFPYWSCFHCHAYRHRTLASSAFWSLHSFLRKYLLQYPWLPFHCPQPSITPRASQQAAICRDFNRRTCCCPNWQFKHICNKSDCGSRKLSWLPVPESTSAVIFLGKYLKVSWIGAVSSWGLGSLSYSSISWRTCLNLAAWYSWGAIFFVRYWISCPGSIWKVWLSWLTALRPLFRGIQLGMSKVLHNQKYNLEKGFPSSSLYLFRV